MTFKVGDIVKAIDNWYAVTRVDNNWAGKVLKINENGSFDAITLSDICCGCQYYDLIPGHFEIVDHLFKKIIITTDGVTTTARLIEGKKVKRVAESRCHKDDTFDFKVGTKIAFDRLMKEQEISDPKYLNGKVVCIRSDLSWWTAGKVYTVVDGIIHDNNGTAYPRKGFSPYKDYEDIRCAGAATSDGRHSIYTEFIEFKGE